MIDYCSETKICLENELSFYRQYQYKFEEAKCLLRISEIHFLNCDFYNTICFLNDALSIFIYICDYQGEFECKRRLTYIMLNRVWF